MRLGVIGLLLCCLAAVSTGHSETTRTQTIQLHQGWNAVFLEVYPPALAPAEVFANTPVDVAASYYPPSSSAQFMTQPGVDLFKQAGWGVWYAEHRPDAFLKTLHSILGQQAYLLYAKSDYTWTVTGEVVPSDIRWQPDSYNFVGFSVRTQGAPTFAQFFAGSRAHNHNRIYRLVNGTWRRVSAPDAETMRAGEAFWIYSTGGSSYQGPLRVETLTRQGLVLGSSSGAVTLRNLTDQPVTPTLEHVASGENPVPMSLVIQMVGDPAASVKYVSTPQPDGSWTQPLPPLEAGTAIRVPLEVRLKDMRVAVHSSLLKITTDLGTQHWIPVIGHRQDLEEK